MKLAQVTLLPERLHAERRRDDRGGLDGARQHAGEHDVGTDAPRRGEMIAECFSLASAKRCETSAAAMAADDTLEAGVGVSVTHEDQPHVPSLYAVSVVPKHHEPLFT
jgi:hypothetical protein